jgi:diketogulonate reductase-like aldo/keto reductase
LSDNPRKKRLRILSTALNLDRIPLIGFGTYAVKTPQVLYNALSVGCRHLDLAENYNNLQHVKRLLGIEVNEMICLWEALFPDDQNYF